MNFLQLLTEGCLRLEKAGVVEAEVDARLLLEAASGKSRTELYLHGADIVSKEVAECFTTLLDRRCQREPVAYILQQREFWSLPFYVDRRVLIPRPETEFLLETVFAYAKAENFYRGAVVDLCTGSGAVAIVLAKERRDINIIASDISSHALAVACKNVFFHQVAERIFPLCCDLLSPFSAGSLSVVVANPPYIAKRDIAEELAPEVSRFEPYLALDGGDDGLVLIRRIEEQLRSCLCFGGDFFMEFGAGQGGAVQEIFAGSSWKSARIFCDYAGRDRVLWARKA